MSEVHLGKSLSRNQVKAIGILLNALTGEITQDVLTVPLLSSGTEHNSNKGGFSFQGIPLFAAP